MNSYAMQLSKKLPELDGDNYFNWDDLWITFVEAAGLHDTITSNTPPHMPAATAEQRAAALELFHSRSKQTLGILRMHVSEHWRTELRQLGFTTAKPAYDWLKTQNVTIHEHRRPGLRKQLRMLQMDISEGVKAYVERAEGLYHTLMLMSDTLYTPANREAVLEHIVDGLPPSWETAQLLLRDHDASNRAAGKPVRTLLNLKGELVRVETQMQASQERAATNSAYAAVTQARGNTSTNRASCGYCSKPGHTSDVCFKKYRDTHPGSSHAEAVAAGRENKNASTSQPAHHARMADTLGCSEAQLQKVLAYVAALKMEGSTPVPVMPEPWCIDSGATAHMSPHSTNMLNYRKLSTPMKVMFAGNTVGDIVGIGTQQVTTRTGTFTMHRVLHVPDLVGNLLSLAECWRSKIGVHFDPENDIVNFTQAGKLVMTASYNQGLYYLDQKHHALAAAAIGAAPPKDALHWHRALGHVSFTMLAHMKRNNLLPSKCTVTAAEFLQASKATCEPCVLGKNTRGSRPASLHLPEHPCYILHADLAVAPTHDSQRNIYTLCILDGNTSFSVVYLLKLKSDAVKRFPEAIAFFERQSGRKVQRIRTDRGGEFLNATLGNYFKSKGIAHELTGGYSSESNAKAERLIRTLMDKTRTQLKAAKLPHSDWGLSMLMANHLHNCIPVQTKTNRTSPFEAFYGYPPDLSYLQPFGSTAYVHVPKALRKKLDDRAAKGTLVGYAEPIGSHTYIIRMPNGAIKHSRDVTFDAPGHTVFDTHAPHYAPTAAVGTPPEVAGPPAPKAGGDSDSDEDEQYTDQPQLGNTPVQTLDDAPAPNPPGAPAFPPTQASERQPRERKRPDRYVAQRVTSSPSVSEQPSRATGGTQGTSPPAKSPQQAPGTYAEATHADRIDRDLWIEAMRKEYNSLIGFGAWELVPKADIPPDKNVIGCRWTYAIKADGRYKARLVAQGFTQRPGLDYDETYAPTSKLSTLRTFLSIVASNDLECTQLDVATAFLHAPIDEHVYMRQPKGFEHGPDLLCRLLRALYGLRQAGRLWHLELRDKLLANGFTQSESDPSMFILCDAEGVVVVLVYVDDCLVAGTNPAQVQRVVALIASLFTCVVLGEPKLFLGIEISRDRTARTLTISQNSLVDGILAKYRDLDIKPHRVPMQPTLRLTKEGAPMRAPQELYGSLLGSIMYASNGTRPDIAFATNRLARYTQNPTQQHWEALLYLLGYLARYPHVGITYGAERGVRVYSDADHAGDTDTSRSTGGFAVLINGGLTSWRSKIQASAAKSTCEAEYRASNAAACEVLWYNKLLPELGHPLKSPININCDNQSAEALLKNPMSTEQSKYFRIFWHFGRDAQMRGELTFSYIKSENNIADPFTKALPETQLLRLMDMAGVHINRAT